MLPNWLINKIEKKKEKFIQEELYIEEYPVLQEIHKEEKIEKEYQVIVIDLL